MVVKSTCPISGVEYLSGSTFYYKVVNKGKCIIFNIPESGVSTISYESNKKVISDILIAIKDDVIQEIPNKDFEAISAQFYCYGHTIN